MNNIEKRYSQNECLPVRVALLTNILLGYRVALFEALSVLVKDLKIFLSVRNESNRPGPVCWGTLKVQVQRSISWRERFRSVHGFDEEGTIHVPIDTLWELFRYRPDVIISGELGARTIFSAIYKIFFRRTKLIIWATLSQRTEETRGSFRQVLRRWLLRHSDGVFVNGQDGERYIRHLGFEGKITYVPYVIDNETFSKALRRSEGTRINLLYTGQLIERKGLCAFLKILLKWAEANPRTRIRLRVAGTGSELSRLEELAAQASFPIEFIGHLGLERLVKEYEEASISVFPTYADEWGVVVNESLSAGVPMLGSCHSQGVKELLEDGVSGWIFDPTDEHGTYQSLERALKTSPTRRLEMSRECRSRVSDYTAAAVAVKIRAALSDITQKI